jgi:hypothetical protein
MNRQPIFYANFLKIKKKHNLLQFNCPKHLIARNVNENRVHDIHKSVYQKFNEIKVTFALISYLTK